MTRTKNSRCAFAMIRGCRKKGQSLSLKQAIAHQNIYLSTDLLCLLCEPLPKCQQGAHVRDVLQTL